MSEFSVEFMKIYNNPGQWFVWHKGFPIAAFSTEQAAIEACKELNKR